MTRRGVCAKFSGGKAKPRRVAPCPDRENTCPTPPRASRAWRTCPSRRSFAANGTIDGSRVRVVGTEPIGIVGHSACCTTWGILVSGRPHDIHLTYSVHYCTKCRKYFNADMSDLALPKSHYTHRVVALAVRVVVEDGLPYQVASWHLWRDHRVFVPWATIQNWVEAGGKKGGGPHRGRVPRLGPGRLLRLHRRRRTVRRAVLRAVDRR